MFRCCSADPKSTVIEQQKSESKTSKAASGSNPSNVDPSSSSSSIIPLVAAATPNLGSPPTLATSIVAPATANKPLPVAKSSAATSLVPPLKADKAVPVAPSIVATSVVPSVTTIKSGLASKSPTSSDTVTSPVPPIKANKAAPVAPSLEATSVVPSATVIGSGSASKPPTSSVSASAQNTKSVTASINGNPEIEEDEEMNAEIFSILQNIQQRLSNIESGMGQSTISAPSSDSTPQSNSDASGIPRSITAFDEYSSNFMDPFVAACKKLGGDAATGGNLLKDAWNELRSFLLMASACKEPPAAGVPPLLVSLSAKIKAVTSAVQRNDWEKHMKTLNEGVQSLNWVIVKPAPCEFIVSYSDGAEYWANNIRKEYRTTNPDQMEFCSTFKTLMLELVKYVKEFHKTGITWNPRGIDVTAYSGSKIAAASPVAAPMAPVNSASSTPKPAGPDLFAALNKGGNITSGLKTVTKEQQTWRAEYKGDAPPPTPAAKVAARNAPVAANSVKGPPKLEFQNAGSKWLVENQTDKNGVVVVKITEMKETVYIYGCADATIDIKGKCKSIVVDGCKKTKVCYTS